MWLSVVALPLLQYTVPDGFTTVVTKRRSPSFSIGKDAKGKLSRSTALESPGPGAYGAQDGIGPQTVSSKQSSATFKFGTSQRGRDGVNESPGPGAYGYNGAFPKRVVWV